MTDVFRLSEVYIHDEFAPLAQLYKVAAKHHGKNKLLILWQ